MEAFEGENMTMLDENNRIMLALLRAAIWGEERFPFPADESADWPAIYNELRMQTVSALPVEVVSRGGEEVKNISFQSAVQNVSLWYALMQEQQLLYELFQENAIPFVILKGASAAVYYPEPVYRTMGDIDLIVRPSDYERALQCMQDHGYEVENLINPRHAGLRKNGIEFELHRYFSTFNQKECLDLLDGMIFNAIDKAEKVEIEGFSFPMLPPLENGLVLLEHINQHLEDGLGLRQLMDWMLYADHELKDEYYQKIFQPVIRQLGLEKLAVTATRMCQIYLGLSENITWCRDAEEDLCHRLMELTLQRGNFGHKNPRDIKTVTVLDNLKNWKQAFIFLQSTGCRTWKVLEKYPFLKSFAWMYQIGRFIRRGLSRKHPLRSLARNAKESQWQGELMDRLGVTRRDKGVATPLEKEYEKN